MDVFFNLQAIYPWKFCREVTVNFIEDIISSFDERKLRIEQLVVGDRGGFRYTLNFAHVAKL